METLLENKYVTLFIGQMTLMFGFTGLCIFYIGSFDIPIVSSILLGISIVFNPIRGI